MPELIYTPELIFNPQWNYTADEISDLAGIPKEIIERADAAREIASVCTMARDGARKAWKGDKVAAWIRRNHLTVVPSEIVRRTVRPVEADE